MLRPLVLLFAVAIAAVPAPPAAAQQPRRTPPARRRPPPVTAPRIPTPRSVLGFEPGDDRKLADWPTLVRYYQALASASDRMRYRELGHSTLGAPMIALVISSPQNLRALERYREVNAKLADPRGFKTAKEAEDVLRGGKAIVLITSGIHSTEVGGHLSPAVLAYRLASDNSLDWYAFTQVETQLVVDSIHNVWHPQIVHDIHQQDTDGSRLFLPPYLDPIEPNVDPLLVDGVNALGTAMAWALAGQGKTGIVINAVYDAWTPARAYQHYHGGVRILSEAASANLASPIDLPADQLATRGRGFNPRERSWNFTNPWPGGRWTLRDIGTYQTDGAYALLENAARYRDRWLANFLTIEGRAVRGWKGWPYAYVLPRQHQDSVGLATLLGILHRGQVEVRTALHPVAVGTQRFPAGSYVVALRQPYAGFAKTLLEPQRYPDLRLYPGGPPLPPYDVTAHTLPLLMGVTAVAARDSLRFALSAPVEPPAANPGYPGFAGPEAPRVGLYRSYAAPIDEGWTRWVFDTWKVPYVSVVDSVVRAGKLRDHFDVIVLPDQSPHELFDGLPRQYPAPYAGGLGTAGVEALRQFVTDGGTLVALNDASRFAVERLLLPVRNVLESVADDEL